VGLIVTLSNALSIPLSHCPLTVNKRSKYSKIDGEKFQPLTVSCRSPGNGGGGGIVGGGGSL